MRYFLDTEYNGWRGELLSLALVPEDRGEEFYVTLQRPDRLERWVEGNVIPYLDMVPQALISARLTTGEAAHELSRWLTREHDAQYFPPDDRRGGIEILADWPEDISQICSLLTTGPGMMVEAPSLSFTLLRIPGFSTAANSKVPHNALHDARALRDHVMAME